MLSVTNSVNDVKARIVNSPKEYGFSTPQELIDSITVSIDDVRLEFMIPALGEAYYNQLAAKDKVGLTLSELSIYKGETFFAVYKFLHGHAEKEVQKRAGTAVSKSQSGGSVNISGDPGKEESANKFYKEALKHMHLAGYRYQISYSQGGIAQRWITEIDEFNDGRMANITP